MIHGIKQIFRKFSGWLYISIIVGGFILYFFLQGCAKLIRGGKPNFVIIFTDDQGYGDVGCYGAEGFKTPNLDSMASEGIIFTDFYAAPACTPSRAALLTGCYAQRVGLPMVVRPPGPPMVGEEWKLGLNPEEETIAELLKQEGYSTGIIGKWHLGHHAEFLPTNQGFDYYFGIPYSNDMNPQNREKYPPLPILESWMTDSMFILDTFELNPEMSKLTTLYTERAINFIEDNRNQPFFLYLAHTMPHIPIGVSEKFKEKSEQGLYGDVMMEIDWSVGQVLTKLKKLNLEKKTLVIFTSDNGPWLVFGNHGGSTGPLRGSKGTTFEGGVRVPCIMKWPGRIPAGKVCNQMATTMDFLPTFVKLAGANLPEKTIDGKDIWPLISAKPGSKSPYDAFFYYSVWGLEAVRSGKWKLHVPHDYRYPEEIGRGGKMGKYTHKHINTSLYNLENDIGEQNDVSKENPEVVDSLLKLIEEMRRNLGDSYTNMEGNNRRLPGKITPESE
jgi:arylsulfatase